MKTAKHFLGFRITKYDNELTCYVHYYETIDCHNTNYEEMNFDCAKEKFGLTEETYTLEKEENKTIYTRK